MKRVVIVATVVFAVLAGGAQWAGASTHLTGGGSGFAGPEIDQWKADTAVNPYNLSINYVAQGSSFGRVSFYSNTLDFGASDITYPSFEIPQVQTSSRCAGKALRNCFVYVPVSAGGVAFMYNLADGSGNRVTNLRLTRDAACKIFTGAIKKWNDPELVATNPFLASFSTTIGPVIRSDGAGESYVLSQFCIAVDKPVWNAFIDEQKRDNPTNIAVDFAAGQPVSNWPAFAGANPVSFADGVANVVASPEIGPNTITYVAASYAKQRSFPVASLQNASGAFTQPDEENVTVALGYATPNPSADAAGTFLLNFTGPDPRAYFPSTYSYILAQTSGWAADKGAVLGQFLCYAISAGQGDAVPLRYARLSAPIVSIAIDAISQIPGAPGKNSCYIAGAAPPPPPPVVDGGATGFGGPAGTTTGTDATNVAANTHLSAAAKAKLIAAARAAAIAKKRHAAAAAVAAEAADSGPTPESVAQQIAAATHNASPASKHPSAIWLLVGGIALAWIVSLLIAWRKAAASP